MDFLFFMKKDFIVSIAFFCCKLIKLSRKSCQCSARVWDWERVFGTGFGFSGVGSGLGKRFYTRFIWERGWKYSRKPNYLGTGLGMGLGLHKHTWVLSPGFSGFLKNPFPFPKPKIFDTRVCLGTKFSKHQIYSQTKFRVFNLCSSFFSWFSSFFTYF